MTKKERAYKLHYKMWDWLSQHPDKDKVDWPGWKFNGGQYVEYLCFLCEIHKYGGFCIECPLGCCIDSDSLYILWRSAPESEKQHYAIKIRDAVRKGGK